MKKMISVPIILMTLSTFAFAAISQEALKKIDQDLLAANQALPIKVPNSNLTVEKVIREDETIIYHYSVAENMTDSAVQEKQLTQGHQALCQHDKYHLDLGFKNKYIYTYKNGIVVENYISKEICSQY